MNLEYVLSLLKIKHTHTRKQDTCDYNQNKLLNRHTAKAVTEYTASFVGRKREFYFVKCR